MPDVIFPTSLEVRKQDACRSYTPVRINAEIYRSDRKVIEVYSQTGKIAPHYLSKKHENH